MANVVVGSTLRATRRHGGRGGGDDESASPASAPGDATPDVATPGTLRDVSPGATDEALLRAAQRDPLAFAPLYQRYATPVFRYCFRQTSDAEVAADLAAQVFTKALEALPRFRFRDEGATAAPTVRSWLFAIAHNAIVDYLRRERTSPTQSLSAVRPFIQPNGTRHQDASDALHALADPALGPEDLAIHRDELGHLLAVLDQLPGNQRAIIELRLAGLTTAEVAQALGLTQPAVKAAQTRAYSRLRDLLEPPPQQVNAATSSSDPHPHPLHPPVEEASR